MKIIHNEGEEIQLLLDYNEALDILRAGHRKYKSAERCRDWCLNYITRYNILLREDASLRQQRQIKKYEAIMNLYLKYETAYQLLFKHRRKKNEEISDTKN